MTSWQMRSLWDVRLRAVRRVADGRVGEEIVLSGGVTAASVEAAGLGEVRVRRGDGTQPRHQRMTRSLMMMRWETSSWMRAMRVRGAGVLRGQPGRWSASALRLMR
jgi:hypothetical protein